MKKYRGKRDSFSHCNRTPVLPRTFLMISKNTTITNAPHISNTHHNLLWQVQGSSLMHQVISTRSSPPLFLDTDCVVQENILEKDVGASYVYCVLPIWIYPRVDPKALSTFMTGAGWWPFRNYMATIFSLLSSQAVGVAPQEMPGAKCSTARSATSDHRTGVCVFFLTLSP